MTFDPWSVLSAKQAEVARAFLAARETEPSTSSSTCRARTRTAFRRPTATSISELLAIKQRGERQELDREEAQLWRARLAAAIDEVDAAWRTSVLPAEPPPDAVDALDRWLQQTRKTHW